eukprot:2056546-Rhodomonas_salina.1
MSEADGHSACVCRGHVTRVCWGGSAGGRAEGPDQGADADPAVEDRGRVLRDRTVRATRTGRRSGGGLGTETLAVVERGREKKRARQAGEGGRKGERERSAEP